MTMNPSLLAARPFLPGSGRNLRLPSWWMAVMLLSVGGFAGPRALAAGFPVTDMVFFGRVYNSSAQQVVNTTGPITVKRNSATGVSDPVLASTSELRDPGTGRLEFYVIRIPRQG